MSANKNYINGTSARKLDYNVYEENEVLKEKKKHKSNNKIKSKMIFSFMIIFALGFVILGRYATLTQLNYNVSKYTNEYNEIQDKNVKLKVDIQSKTDLNKVRQIAEQKLGMQKPDKNQIVYVDVPKTDFTVVNDKIAGTAVADKGVSISTLMYNVAKFIGFV
ncbi:MAG: cell division protein FtsL [Clostridia bacterium]|jgi:cell division protein FtsL